MTDIVSPDPILDAFPHLRHSRALDTSDLDWAAAGRYPVTDDEIRCLTYMSDVEGQTLLYMRDLLTNAAIADPDIATFLPCWAYEEMYHSLALQRFLLEIGVDLGRDRLAKVRGKARFREPIERWGSALVAWLTPGFLAVHMSWGAINERTTLEGYRQLIRRTENPVLAELLTRIIRDERRHYAFYRTQARIHLEKSAWTRKLTRAVLTRVWSPVGSGVKPDEDLHFILCHLFGDEEGYGAAMLADDEFEILPGLEGLRLLTDSVTQATGGLTQKWNATKNPVAPVPTTVSDVVVSTSAADPAPPRLPV